MAGIIGFKSCQESGHNCRSINSFLTLDGLRTSADQAARMRYKIANGAGVREYANRIEAGEILAAYTEAIASQQDPVVAMAFKIQEQADS